MTNPLNEKATYIYTDSAGNTLFTKERYVKQDGSKGYAYCHVNSEGEILKTMPKFAGGTKLYNLHRLAKYPKATVYLVEGEKCVDALTKIRLLATTSGGAQSDERADWQPLAGREVITWADNDDAGFCFIQRATQKLIALNATVKQIDINALNLPVKSDCVDYIANFEALHGRLPTKADIEALTLKADAKQTPLNDNLRATDTNLLPQSDDEVIAWLAALKMMDYDRLRIQQAKALNVRPQTLDSMVKAEREKLKPDDSLFTDIEPWHETIDPAQLLDDITYTIQRFIVLDKHQAQAASLWVTASWFIDVINCAPIALINAPERACGKTQLLSVMTKLAPRATQLSGISPSVLFRMIECYKPTLFIDEIETVLKDNEDLRGLMNAGHTRDSAYVWRSVSKGDDFEPKRFTVWGMKAIAGINAIKLAETVTSRAIVFELRRKTSNETVERLRSAEAGLFEALASKLARFYEDYVSEVQQARPVLPTELADRDQDNWEPLLQIASVAGGHWADTALNVALMLSGSTKTPMSSANELLSDIQEVFEAKQVIKITTTELINALCEDTEKSWATYNRGKQLTPRQLSSKLRDYGISSKTIRTNAYETAKGYESEQFKDAFTRYLADPVNLTSLGNNLLKTNNYGLSSVTDREDVAVTEFQSVTLEAKSALGCDGVTDKPYISKDVTNARNEYASRRF